MDALAGLLDGPRARGAFLLRLALDAPFSLRIQDEAPLTILALVEGSATVSPHDGETIRMRPGDLVLVKGPESWTIGDSPDTPPQVLVNPGNQCMTLYGESLEQKMSLGVRTWGHRPDAETVLITGIYEEIGAVGQRLLDSLPQAIHIAHGDWDTPLLAMLAEEMVKDDCGQEAVLDRLLDLLVVAALRRWMARPDAVGNAWYRANLDPVVGKALRLLYNNPAHHWTVANLASEIGVSRAALARRFTDLVGEPPMTFLTSWRLALAADLLRQPDTTVGAVAREVGYSTPFALSTAFKRHHGVSPQQHRALAV